MNETLFQNLIFLGIMSSTLKGRNSGVNMKITPIINPFGIVERVCVKFYTNERDKEEGKKCSQNSVSRIIILNCFLLLIFVNSIIKTIA